MIQCYVKHPLSPELAAARQPRLLYVSRIDTRVSDFPRVMHRHDGLVELILIYRGQGTYSIDGRQVKVRAGDLVIYNSSVVHDEIAPPEAQLAWVCVAFSGIQLKGLPPNTLARGPGDPVFAAGEAFNSLRDTCDVMFDQLEYDRPGCTETTHYLLQALLSQVLPILENDPGKAGQPSLDEPLAQRVIRYLDSHYMESVSLQDLAVNFKVSAYYLAHVFKNCYGYSPMQYVLRRRVGEAQSLLLTTRLSITDIAFQVGYDHPSHFNRQFSKFVGMPPRKYRTDYIARQGNPGDISLLND